MVDKNTILQRLPELELKVYANNRVRVSLGGESIAINFFGLKILDAFSRARPLGEALQDLAKEVPSAQAWVDLTSAVMGMIKAGILIEPDSVNRSILRADFRGFDAAHIHISMLGDRQRTQSYLQALRAVIRPGDIVLDLGSGSGVFSVAAAQAGATRVYAVEASSMAELAGQVFQANGFQDRILLLQDWSTRVELPEQVDWLVCELIGNDPFQERVLEAIIDARKRFLRPGARVIPAQMRVYALPVSIPESIYKEYFFTQATIDQWRDWYQIEFQPLVSARPPAALGIAFDPRQTRIWSSLTDEILLAEVDFLTIETPQVDFQGEFIAQRDGLLNGVLIYFELMLTQEIRLSVRPDEAQEDNHWRIMAWLLPEPLQVRAGEHWLIHYAYQAERSANGVRVEPAPKNAAQRGEEA